MVVPTQLDHRERQQGEPYGEGDPDAELGREHLVEKVVGVDFLLFVDRVGAHCVGTVFESFGYLLKKKNTHQSIMTYSKA